MCFCLQHYEDRWDVDLDISAPRLIVPEKFTEDNPDVIIIDLGNFCLKTQSAKKVAQSVTAERSWYLLCLSIFLFITQIVFCMRFFKFVYLS